MKAYEEAVASKEKFIVYLTGAQNLTDANGAKSSWCPDCDEARPSINKLLEKNTSRKVVKGLVMTRDEWVGVSTHPYKVHPQIKAGGVPSMTVFLGKNELVRIEDLESFKNDDLMDMLLDD